MEQNARMALKLANNAYVMEVGKITLQGEAKTMPMTKMSSRHIWEDKTGFNRMRSITGIHL